METSFSVSLDLAKAKADLYQTGAEGVRTVGATLSDADLGSCGAAFRVELALRLETVNANVARPWRHGDAGDPVPEGAVAEGDPGVTTAEQCVSEAREGVRIGETDFAEKAAEAGRPSESGKPGEAGQTGTVARAGGTGLRGEHGDAFPQCDARATRRIRGCGSVVAGHAPFRAPLEVSSASVSRLVAAHGFLAAQAGVQAHAEGIRTAPEPVDAIPAPAAAPVDNALPLIGSTVRCAGRVFETVGPPEHIGASSVRRGSAVNPGNTMAEAASGTSAHSRKAERAAVQDAPAPAEGAHARRARQALLDGARTAEESGQVEKGDGLGAGGCEKVVAQKTSASGAMQVPVAPCEPADEVGMSLAPAEPLRDRSRSTSTPRPGESGEGGEPVDHAAGRASASGQRRAASDILAGFRGTGSIEGYGRVLGQDWGRRDAAVVCRGGETVDRTPMLEDSKVVGVTGSEASRAEGGPPDHADHIVLEVAPGEDLEARLSSPHVWELPPQARIERSGWTDSISASEPALEPALEPTLEPALEPGPKEREATLDADRSNLEMKSAILVRSEGSAERTPVAVGAITGAALGVRPAGMGYEALSPSPRGRDVAISGSRVDVLAEGETMLESAVGTPMGLALESRAETDSSPRGAAVIPVETDVRPCLHGDDGDAVTRQAGIPFEGGVVISPPEARSGRPLGIRVPKAGLQVTGRTLVAQAEKKADIQAPAQTRFSVGCPQSPRTPVGERAAASGGRTVGATTRWAAGNEKAEPVSEEPFAAECGMFEARPVHGRAEMPPMPGDRGMPERAVPVTARAVVDQIVRRAEIRLGRSEAEMVIDLKPDALGRVHLRITAEPGRIVAQIRAENSITRQLIEAGLGDLKAALAERGLDLGSVTVSGGFGAGIAWDGSRSRWAQDGAGRGESQAGLARGGERADSLRVVGQFAVARPFRGAAHIVDCVA